ncbi:MAG: hypothetical protein ROO70_21185 [Labrenzia sp.]
MNALKAWDKLIVSNGFCVRYEFDPSHLAHCIISIIWRSVVSKSSFYSSMSLNKSDEMRLFEILKGESSDVLKKCSILINRLSDRTPAEDGGFSQSVISDFVTTIHPYGTSHAKGGLACSVVMQGFLMVLFVPRVSASFRIRPGYLKPKQHLLHAPARDVFDFPPLKAAVIAGITKNKDGEITF